VEFFESFEYRNLSLVQRDTLTSSLPICIPFIFYSCLTALANNCKIILDRSEESGHPFLIPDFRGNVFSFYLLSMMLVKCLPYITFIMLRYILSVLSLIRVFVMKGC
jgi:hypothetical protein